MGPHGTSADGRDQSDHSGGQGNERKPRTIRSRLATYRRRGPRNGCWQVRAAGQAPRARAQAPRARRSEFDGAPDGCTGWSRRRGHCWLPAQRSGRRISPSTDVCSAYRDDGGSAPLPRWAPQGRDQLTAIRAAALVPLPAPQRVRLCGAGSLPFAGGFGAVAPGCQPATAADRAQPAGGICLPGPGA
jgi:hypothetical protein